MDFRILGPVEAFAEGRPLPLRGQRQRALLAYLLLHAGEVVTADRLLVELWVDPPLGGHAALQTLVYRLRQLVGDRILTSGSGYSIRLEPGELDLERYRSRLAEAAASADPAERSRLLRDADALWHGVPLDGLELPFAEADAAALQELRLSALEDRLDAEVELGHAGELVSELSALVSRHPLRERLRGQLILALYRGGRQAEALELCRSTRQLLDEELGLEPSPALRELERAILNHDPALTRPPEPARVVAVASARPARRAGPWLAAAALAAVGISIGGAALALASGGSRTVTTVSVGKTQRQLITRVVRVTTTSRVRPKRHVTHVHVRPKPVPRPAAPPPLASRTTTLAAKPTPKRALVVRPLVVHKPAAPAPKPVTIADGFDGEALDPAIWQAATDAVAQRDGQLVLTVAASADGAVDVHLATQCTFPGDFDARVDFTLREWPDSDNVIVGLSAIGARATVGRESSSRFGDRYSALAGADASSVPLPDTSGSLRIARRKGVLTTYVRVRDAWAKAATARSNDTVVLALQALTADPQASFAGKELQVAFDNFAVTAQSASSCSAAVQHSKA